MAAQVESELQTAPAQSPQKVVSNTICRSLKWLLTSQPENCANGVPHPEGSGELPLRSPGMLPRGKNHTEMVLAVTSVAYTPPWIALKPAPYELVAASAMPQPWLEPPPTAHEGLTMLPLMPPALEMEQPELVCRVAWFVVAELTPSMMSISPLRGIVSTTGR